MTCRSLDAARSGSFRLGEHVPDKRNHLSDTRIIDAVDDRLAVTAACHQTVGSQTGKLLADTTTGSTIRPVQVIKVITPDGTRYLPLYSTVAIAA